MDNVSAPQSRRVGVPRRATPRRRSPGRCGEPLAVSDAEVPAAGEGATTTYGYDPVAGGVPSALAAGDTACGGRHVAWTEILDATHVVTLARLTRAR